MVRGALRTWVRVPKPWDGSSSSSAEGAAALCAGRRTTWCHSIGTRLSKTRPTPSPRIPQLLLCAPMQSASRRSALRATPKATRRETAAILACQDHEDTCLHVTDRPEFFGSMSGVENQTRGFRSCSACPVMVVFPRIDFHFSMVNPNAKP